MRLEGWIANFIGVALLSIVFLDMFFAILYQGQSGVFLNKLHRKIWNLLLLMAPAGTRQRRFILAIAGPIMILLTFVIWLGSFILGFALIYWPYLNSSFRTDAALAFRDLNFLDALYFSGNTGAVLGYGDITPLAPSLKMLAIIEAGLGFAVVTGVVTYLLQVNSGVTKRNSLAMRLNTESKTSGNGAQVLARMIQFNGVKDLNLFFETLLERQQMAAETTHQFPIIDIYYRSRSKTRDPELIVLSLCEYMIMLRLIASTQSGQRLLCMADRFEGSVLRSLSLIGGEHLKSHPQNEVLAAAEAGQDKSLKDFMRALKTGTQEEPSKGGQDHARDLIYRSRLFLLQIDQITEWRQEHQERSTPLFPELQ